MEDIDTIKEEAGDLSESVVARNFPYFQRKIDRFVNFVDQNLLRLQGHIAELLINIRGNQVEEVELANLFEQMASSPFNNDNLENWLLDCRSEAAVLMAFIRRLGMLFLQHLSITKMLL